MHKTSYDMRISDWSSDVCSSDLPLRDHLQRGAARGGRRAAARAPGLLPADPPQREPPRDRDGAPLVSLGGELHRGLRALRPARPSLAVRPLHPPDRKSTVDATRVSVRGDFVGPPIIKK